jgi:hypothetical protein
MKKLLVILAITGSVVACNNKSDSKETRKDTSATNTNATTTSPQVTSPENTSTSTSGVTIDVPKFKDPEVQKFADDYAAWVITYRAALKDPAKAQEMQKQSTDWSNRSQALTAKLMADPAEYQKMAMFMMKMTQELVPQVIKQ